MDKNGLLLTLLDNQRIDDTYLKVFIYLTLLTINNNSFGKDEFNREINVLEDYLRRVNNLKVKIQLRRKENEIDELIKEIKTIYDEYKLIINRYNVLNLDALKIIENKDPGELTKLIDMQTKEKMARVDKRDYYFQVRDKIMANYPADFEIVNGNINFYLMDQELSLSIDEFYKIFDYLTNIDYYKQPFLMTKANREHTVLIGKLIKSFIDGNIDLEEILAIVLTNHKFIDTGDINTSDFIIKNIKITDLYKEADRKDIVNKDELAKWKNLTISNEYLFSKLNDIVKKGEYYFVDDNLILENVVDNMNDFKVSIEKEKMQNFLITDLKNMAIINREKR